MPRSPILRPVSAPLSSTPLSRLIYVLITLSVLFISYYSYRGLQYKYAVGSWWWWWDVVLGVKTPPAIVDETWQGSSVGCHCGGGGGGGGEESVEDRINGLARVLGIPSKELASAVAGVVRQYVPTGA